MRKYLLTLTLALLTLGQAKAGKAWPHPITVTQSNGQTITVRLHGDEHFHWYTDMQGNILERHGNDFTPIATDRETFMARGQEARAKAMRREPIATSAKLFPHTGSPRVLVILAEYQDKAFTVNNPKANFDQYLNKEGVQTLQDFGNGENRNYGSVRQYFIDQSSGQFSPQFDVHGPIRLPHSMAYYGGTDPNGGDERYRELLQDACTAINDSVNFADYDQDGDGRADLVYVIYAGYGQSSGAANETMWPKRFPGFASPTYDGKGINQGGISNELMAYEGALSTPRINGIGLFVHEFSHCLGLPDFYATATSAQGHDNQGMEDWSVMDNGEYVSNGNVPAAYTAWEREAMGWDEIPAITTAQQYRLDGTLAGGSNAVKIVNPNDPNEYFVLQHFEDKGWNQRMARDASYNPNTQGLLVYHVNYNSSAFNITNNTVNNTVGKPRMTVVPADGRLVSSYRVGEDITALDYAKQLHGDLFLGDATFAQGSGLPNAAWWTAAAETKVYNINYNGGAVYLDYLNAVATTGIDQPATTTDRPANARIYTLDGRYVGTNADTLPRGIYIRGGKKFVK